MIASLRKAQQALASSRILLKEGDTEGACNRAYYAMFYAAHVALRATGAIETGTVYKTHSGLISAFGRELVLTGAMPDRLGRALSKVHDMRLLGDYSGEAPVQALAQWAIDEAEIFVAAIAEKFGGPDR